MMELFQLFWLVRSVENTGIQGADLSIWNNILKFDRSRFHKFKSIRSFTNYDNDTRQ